MDEVKAAEKQREAQHDARPSCLEKEVQQVKAVMNDMTGRTASTPTGRRCDFFSGRHSRLKVGRWWACQGFGLEVGGSIGDDHHRLG